jgi:methyl-accepting chemotaxis protein
MESKMYSNIGASSSSNAFISRQLTRSFGALILVLLLILVGAGGFVFNLQAQNAKRLILAETAVGSGETLRLHMAEMSEAMRGYLLDPGSTVEFNKKKAADEALDEEAKSLTEMTKDVPAISAAAAAIADFDAQTLNPSEDKIFDVVKESVDAGRKYYAQVYMPLRLQEQVLVDKMIEEIAKWRTSVEQRGARLDSYILIFSVFGVALALILAIAIANWIGVSITRPILALSARMTEMAKGELDFAIPGVGRQDEVGQMAKAVQIFRDNELEAIRFRDEQRAKRMEAEAQAERQREATAKIIAEQKTASIQGMAKRIESETRDAIRMIANAAGSLDGSARNMAEQAVSASTGCNGVSDMAQAAMASVQSTLAVAQQFAGSINQISQQVSLSNGATSAAVESSKQAEQIIASMSESVLKISEVTRLISDIAAKTNLLALNATIEAARAGEAGRGFAVVASEVKSLATQTSKSTEDINRQIAEVQAVTKSAVEVVGRIGARIGEISSVSDTINKSIDEQSAATHEITQSISNANHAVQSVAGLIKSVNAEALSVSQQAGSVGKVVSEVASAISTLDSTLIRVVHASIEDVKL